MRDPGAAFNEPSTTCSRALQETSNARPIIAA